jgi:hypothetical protein
MSQLQRRGAIDPRQDRACHFMTMPGPLRLRWRRGRQRLPQQPLPSRLSARSAGQARRRRNLLAATASNPSEPKPLDGVSASRLARGATGAERAEWI